MFLERASQHVTKIMGILEMHRKFLNKFKKLFGMSAEEIRILMEGLEMQKGSLMAETHFFAFQCRQDRPSTELLLQNYRGELKGCLWQIGNIVSWIEKKDCEDHSQALLYLTKLERVLRSCLEQLICELGLNYFPSYPPPYVQPNPIWPPAVPAGPVEAPRSLFPAGCPPSSEEATASPLPPEALEELVSRFRPGLSEKEMEDLFIRLLHSLKNRIAAPAKKRGRPGRNSQLTFEQLVHLLLSSELHKLLLKYLGCDRTYRYLALLGGGNEKDVGEYIRNFDTKKKDRDPKYILDDKNKELIERSQKLLGERLKKLIRKIAQD